MFLVMQIKWSVTKLFIKFIKDDGKVESNIQITTVTKLLTKNI